MGQYDNFSNAKNIERLEKKIAMLERQRKPDLFQIKAAKSDLNNLKPFRTCQIFGRTGFAQNIADPNQSIMFSDDNRLLWFDGVVIPYEKIAAYAMTEKTVTKAHTKTKSKGALSRVIIGGAIAGDIGAIIGGMTADSESTTTFREQKDGFILTVILKNKSKYIVSVPNNGILSNAYSRMWQELMAKLQMIIDENKSKRR